MGGMRREQNDIRKVTTQFLNSKFQENAKANSRVDALAEKLDAMNKRLQHLTEQLAQSRRIFSRSALVLDAEEGGEPHPWLFSRQR